MSKHEAVAEKSKLLYKEHSELQSVVGYTRSLSSCDCHVIVRCRPEPSGTEDGGADSV